MQGRQGALGAPQHPFWPQQGLTCWELKLSYCRNRADMSWPSGCPHLVFLCGLPDIFLIGMEQLKGIGKHSLNYATKLPEGTVRWWKTNKKWNENYCFWTRYSLVQGCKCCTDLKVLLGPRREIFTGGLFQWDFGLRTSQCLHLRPFHTGGAHVWWQAGCGRGCLHAWLRGRSCQAGPGRPGGCQAGP